MATAKNEVFIRLLHENCYLVFSGGGTNLWLGESTGGGFFQVGGGISKFSAGGRNSLPHLPQICGLNKTEI